MSRKELANKVFEILRSDMQLLNKSDLDLWQAIAETDDNTLLEWLKESEEE